MQAMICDLVYYTYVLLFGVYIAVRIACRSISRKAWRLYGVLSLLLLLVQAVCLRAFGMGGVQMLYPLIGHLPVALTLIWILKVRWDGAVVSVVISYSMCQLLRWIGLVLGGAQLPPIIHTSLHLVLCHGLLLLLNRYCLGPIHDVIHSSAGLRLRFGALPVIYYLYEYFMIFTRNRYAHILAFNELMSTGMVLFFILFVIAYRGEQDKREEAERQTAGLELQLSRAEHEIGMLRTIQEQTAIYRHDLRHHLRLIDEMIASGGRNQAREYIRKAESEIEGIVPRRYCENETVNLLLCAFGERAAARGIGFSVRAALPQKLGLPDTELCAVLSNGLENAMNAVSCLPEQADRSIDVFCGVRQENLLIEIKNPYTGELRMEDGLPVGRDGSEHYGCRSIRSIVQHRKGVSSFEGADGGFVMRVAIPMVWNDAYLQRQ